MYHFMENVFLRKFYKNFYVIEIEICYIVFVKQSVIHFGKRKCDYDLSNI